jgi:hypothetical protein
MERQNRLLTVLAVVFLALLAIVVLGNEPDGKSDDPHAPPERALFEGFKGDDTTTLTVSNASGTMTFTKRDGAWKMTAPTEMAVEERRVDEIVDRLASLKVQEGGFSGDLAAFGLDTASRITVTVATADGKTRTAWVGRDAPVGYRGYVADTEGGPALLASSKLTDLVGRTPDDFRARDVWKISSGSAKRLRIESAGQITVLRKDDHGWWIGDEGPRAEERAVEDWLTKASFLRVDSFLDGADPSSVGLQPPAARFTVEDDEGTHAIELGTRDDTGVVVSSAGQIVRVGSEATELVKSDGWTSAELIPVRRAQLDAVEITLGDTVARFAKTDDTWKDATERDAPAAEKFLDTLAEAKADRTRPVAEVGATWGTLSLAEGAARKELVTIGQELPEGGRAAKDAAGGPPFRIPAETLTALLAALK